MIALLAATAGPAIAGHGKRHGPVGLVNSIDVQNNSLTGADIKNKSLTPADFRGSVRGPRGPQGSQGPAGNNGANGAPGQQGPPGFSVLNYVTVNGIANPPNTITEGRANCPSGQYPIGGGTQVQFVDIQHISGTRPDRSANGWLVYIYNSSTTTTGTFSIYAVCAPAAQVTGGTALTAGAGPATAK